MGGKVLSLLSSHGGDTWTQELWVEARLVQLPSEPWEIFVTSLSFPFIIYQMEIRYFCVYMCMWWFD